jgi:teichuronic acid biosynthesis glycosyltransferase TuaC
VRTLVVTNLPRPFVAAQLEGLRRIGVEVELLYLDRANLGPTVYAGALRRVRRAVASTAPDVVHVMYGGVMAEIATHAVRDRPVVVTFYGSDLLGGRERRGPVKRLAVRFGVGASRRVAARASAVIVQSQVLAEALPERDRARAHVIPDGIDTAVFAPKDRLECRRALGWEANVKHVLFPATRTRPEKRFELAQAAVDLIEPRGTVRLHELSGVPHHDVPIWLNAADVVVLTSTHEGSPNVVKEALACNVAVVSVDVGDVREWIDEIDGCFLAEETPEDVADKLRRALARDRRVDGRARMDSQALERVATRILDVYRSVSGAF